MHFANAKPLPAGQEITLDFRTQRYQIFRLDAPRGSVIDLKVEQKGVDVELFFFQDRVTPYEIDSPNGERGPENFFAVSEGNAWVVVGARDGLGNNAEAYALAGWAKPRAAIPQDRIRASAERNFATAEALRIRHHEGGEAFYALANVEWRAIGAADSVARTQLRLGRFFEDLGDSYAAIGVYENLKRAGFSFRQAALHLAFCYHDLGRFSESEATYREVLADARREKDGSTVASQLQNIAGIQMDQGRYRAAQLLLDEALDYAVSNASRSTIYYIRGNASLALQLFDAAISDYKISLRFAYPLDFEGQSQIVRTIAMAYMRSGRLVLADRAATRALELARRSGTQSTIALCLVTKGELEQTRGYFSTARGYFARALRLVPTVPINIRGNALASLGQVEVQIGSDREGGIQKMEDALRIYQTLKNRSAEVDINRELGIARTSLGQPEMARTHFEAAIERLEEMRLLSVDPEVRIQLLATRRVVYEYLVDTYLSLAQNAEDSTFIAKAFDVAERSRSRGLLDELTEFSEEGNPVDTSTAQRLLDSDTSLIAFSLGEKRSAVFVIDKKSVQYKFLPGRRAIGDVVSAWLGEVKRRPSLTGKKILEARQRSVSRLLFGQFGAEDSIRRRRIVICPDGILEKVPFGLLNLRGEHESLGLGQEVVVVPSTSVLSRLRVARPQIGPGFPQIGALVDPEFGSALPRLEASAREGKALSSLFPDSSVHLWQGRNVSRSLLFGAEVAKFNLVHIATHVDSPKAHGGKLGLAFSAPGEGRSGGVDWVSIEDIGRLNWQADLVVLSGCETGLGPTIEAEGVQSLGRAFLRAGARRVLVSLWRVDDDATSELMLAFYRSLASGALPAKALLSAQNKMARSQSRFSDPYFWGGFVLLGDWR